MAPRISSRSQADRTVSQLGRLMQQRKNRKDRLDRKIAFHTGRLDALKAQEGQALRSYDERIMDKARLLLAFCRANLPLLSPNGGSTAVLDTGTASFHTLRVGALQFSEDEAATIDEIRTLVPGRFDEFVKTTHEIRKNALKAAPEVLERLNTAWAGPSEFFSVEPDNTTEKFNRRTAEIEATG